MPPASLLSHPQWAQKSPGREIVPRPGEQSSMRQLRKKSMDPGPGSSERPRRHSIQPQPGASFTVWHWHCFGEPVLTACFLIFNVGQSVPLSGLNIKISREPWASGLFVSPSPLSFSSIIISKWKNSHAASGSFGWFRRAIQLPSGLGAQIRQG